MSTTSNGGQTAANPVSSPTTGSSRAPQPASKFTFSFAAAAKKVAAPAEGKADPSTAPPASIPAATTTPPPAPPAAGRPIQAVARPAFSLPRAAPRPAAATQPAPAAPSVIPQNAPIARAASASSPAQPRGAFSFSSKTIPPQVSSPRPSAVAPSAPPTATVPPSSGQGGFSFGVAAVDPVVAANRAIAPDELTGMLTELKMYNDWGVGKVIDSSGRKVSVKGAALSGCQAGMRYRFAGKQSHHEKFGQQFEVVQVAPDMESVDALIAHMQRNYRNVGYTTAKKMAEHHRANGTIAQLKDDLIYRPSMVDFRPFTDKEVALRDDEDSHTRRVKDSLSIRFGGKGIAQKVLGDLGSWLIQKAQEKIARNENQGLDLVATANAMLDDNPYKPITAVERYAFQTADLIGREVGIKSRDPKRVAAIVTYALDEGCNSGGHMWLHEQAFFDSIRRIDRGLDPEQAVAIALEQEEPIVLDGSFGATRYYPAYLRKAETTLVTHLSMRLTDVVDPLCSLEGQELEDAIDRAVRAVGESKGKPDFKLDDSQRGAVRGILTSTCSLHTLTAGPGCGKTAIVEVMMEVLGYQDRPRTTFCAPVGKAAKVLSNRIRKWGVAKTLHSTLEFVGQFQRNADNPLDCDLAVADEQSMLGGPLGAAFLDAVPARAHLLLLGDQNQLGSIEPGRVLKSILEVEGFDHHRLTQTHRNDGAILELVGMVTDGYWPTGELQAEVEEKGGVEFAGLPEPTDGAVAGLAVELKEAAEKYGGLDRVGVICPIRKGNTKTPGWNVTYLNSYLRDALNPDLAETKKVAGTAFRIDDRIIVTKNMWISLVDGPVSDDDDIAFAPVHDEYSPYGDDGTLPPEDDPSKTYVVNGDTGSLEAVRYHYEDGAKKPRELILRLDDDRRVSFPAAELDHIGWSYVITTHAAQGSEYLKTFAIVPDGHESFMHRAMLMTQLSRAQVDLKVMGEDAIMVKVASRPAPERNCALVERTLKEAGLEMGDKLATNYADRPRDRNVA